MGLKMWTWSAQRVRSGAVAVAIAASAAGCQSRRGEPLTANPSDRANEVMVRMVFDQAARNAALTERTVFPYHFTPDGATLNELGESHIAMLAEAYRAGPGRLGLARGDASPELHRARVEAVRRQLGQAGVAVDQVTIGASRPGGSGMSSLRLGQMLGETGRGSEANAGRTGSSGGSGARPPGAAQAPRANER